ncbi:hypothetical protein N7448_009691 [Penicillium atrosanguineum]|nr:hypothetical protein N7448_009691 [Penicillium atrosanguineum]
MNGSADIDIPDGNPHPLNTSQVRDLLKRKRRFRGIKSCFPCRHRKVRCDGASPCATCVQRGHPELCCTPSASGSGQDFERGGGRPEIWSPGLGRSAPTPSSSMDLMISRLESIEEQISSLKADLIQTRAHGSSSTEKILPHSNTSANLSHRATALAKSPGMHFLEDATGATIFLGSHSDIPAALGCRLSSGGTTINDSFVLDQVVPRTYPFTSLWGADAGPNEICRTLPEDVDIMRYWHDYQTFAYPYYPGLVTLDQFNISLFEFLDRRAALASEENASLDDVDSSWLALLFAVLACGVQFSNDPIKERDLRSKVFICSSFQCLRISNFFNNTNLNQIQGMALIGHCLRNNLDTNSAWILMGSTMRLAQSIGLHEEEASSEPTDSSTDSYQRRRLWWMLVWQDTFLSFTYDRPPNIINHSGAFPRAAESETGNSFAESIFSLCQVLLDRSRQENSTTVPATLAFKQRIETIWGSTKPFLMHKSRCRTLQDHLERLALRIHINYGITRLCRLVIEPQAGGGAEFFADINELISECIECAAEAVRSFLEMHRLAATVCRSWAFVHNAVSCAFTLQKLGKNRDQAHSLVSRLIAILEQEERQSSWEDNDTNHRSFGPYSRASRALRETVNFEDAQI